VHKIGVVCGAFSLSSSDFVSYSDYKPERDSDDELMMEKKLFTRRVYSENHKNQLILNALTNSHYF
jgi:hypothetical protein